MSNVWGNSLKISIFGESHGPAIGIVLGGLPPGLEIDLAEVAFQMSRRAPGQDKNSTPRKEQDDVEILSGLFEGKTTGAPLTGIIKNKDIKSADYNKALPRPGHSDYTAQIKYKGFNDYRGGGHFSGRLTASLSFAGSIARQYLEALGIIIGAHILQIGPVISPGLIDIDAAALKKFSRRRFPVGDKAKEAEMLKAIAEAAREGDSLGGIIECAANGFPPGFGTPFFNSLESAIAALVFSIPAVKGVEFGSGFALGGLTGSRAKDELYTGEGGIKTLANHNGGINGGISNGMPIVFKAAFKPTPSIAKPQKTVNLLTGEDALLEIKGRHDPAIVARAAVVVESALAICLLDALLEGGWRF